MSSILIKIAEKRTDWDKIPDYVISAYENELAELSLIGVKGKAFKDRAIEIYNATFSVYGYTKPTS